MDNEQYNKEMLDDGFDFLVKLIIENKNSKLISLMTCYFQVVNGIIPLNNISEYLVKQLAFANKNIECLLKDKFEISDLEVNNFIRNYNLKTLETDKNRYTKDQFKTDLQSVFEILKKTYDDGLINNKEEILKNIKNILEDSYGY